MGFSRQEYWVWLLFPSLGDLPDPGVKPRSSASQADCLSSEPPGNVWPSGWPHQLYSSWLLGIWLDPCDLYESALELTVIVRNLGHGWQTLHECSGSQAWAWMVITLGFPEYRWLGLSLSFWFNRSGVATPPQEPPVGSLGDTEQLLSSSNGCSCRFSHPSALFRRWAQCAIGASWPPSRCLCPNSSFTALHVPKWRSYAGSSAQGNKRDSVQERSEL